MLSSCFFPMLPSEPRASAAVTPRRGAAPTSLHKSPSNNLINQISRTTTPTPLSKTRPTSSSLHNLVTHLNNQSDYMRSMTPTASSRVRLRRDSCASTASSVGTCLSSCGGGGGNGASLCHPSPDYKENKAFELRKKSTLMNKIILKSQLVNDPIFARANPIHQEIALTEQQQFLNDETINYIMGGANSVAAADSVSASSSASARKRLFAKKNERNAFDPNASTASSTTTTTSTSSVPSNTYISHFNMSK